METAAHISSISVAVVTMVGLLSAGWLQLRKLRNRRRDRLIALLKVCATSRSIFNSWPSTLPESASVEFTPKHYSKTRARSGDLYARILVGDEVPAQGEWWRFKKKPLAVFTVEDTLSPIAIIANKPKKDLKIQSQSRAYPGYDFILGFDLALLDSPNSNGLASNHPNLFPYVVSLCHWIVAGPRQRLIWYPYAIIYTTCENPSGECVSFCSRIASRGHGALIRALRWDKGDGARGTYDKAERLFVSSPAIVPEDPIWAEYHSKADGPQRVRQLVYEALSETIGTSCEKLAVPSPEWGYAFPLPTSPETVIRELGWVLHRKLPFNQWESVHQCRVRLTEWGYQGVSYKQPLWPNPADNIASDKVIQSFQNEWDTKKTKFPIRQEWSDACQDIILDTFPSTELPLSKDSESHWLPAEQGDWSGVVSNHRR